MGKLQEGILSLFNRWNKSYLIFCLVFLPFVVFFAFCKPWEITYDLWITAAAVRELSINFFHPSNPIIDLPGYSSPRFVPYTMIWGLFKNITHLNIFTTMGIAAVTNYFIFIVGLYRFVSKQFKNDSLPVYTFFVMLLIWGTGYGWANAYRLEMFLINLPYVGFFNFGLSLNALYYLVCYCEKNKRYDLLLYSLLSIIAFNNHTISGLFCFVAAFAVLLTNVNFKKLILLQSIPLLAFGISLFWPYFSYWDIFIKGTTEVWFKTRLFSHQSRALGLLIVGLPIIIYYALKRKYLLLLYGFLLCSFIYLFSAFRHIFIGGRFIFFIAFFLHLAMSLFLREHNMLNVKKIVESFRTNGLIMVFVFTIFIPSIMNRTEEMKLHLKRTVDKPFKIHTYDSPVKPYLLKEGLFLPLLTPSEQREWLYLKEGFLQAQQDQCWNRMPMAHHQLS